jgi:formylglycine-generating enzyme required for sulfatase activity
MAFSFVPPGTFLMGSPPGEKGRRDGEVRHRVKLTAARWLGTCPVTQAQWQAVTGHSPNRFSGGGHPVQAVSWHECVEFCGKLGGKARLPTEAEWEWACRAGTTTPFYFGDTASAGQANCGGGQGEWAERASGGQTTPVESFLPNAWGLFDLHGNVGEWCADWYGPYPGRDAADPEGPQEGEGRVLRGGSWRCGPRECRSAARSGLRQGDRRNDVGFRVVLGPE